LDVSMPSDNRCAATKVTAGRQNIHKRTASV
jgi:hypothetical protein